MRFSSTVKPPISWASWKLAHQALGGQAVGGGPGDVLTEEKDPPGFGAEHAGDDIETGGLAGAVGPDQAGDVPARQGESQVVKSLHTFKGFLEAAGLENKLRYIVPRL